MLHVKDDNQWDNPGYSVARISRNLGKQSSLGIIGTNGNALSASDNSLAGVDLRLVEVMRGALAATYRDPAFLEDARKMQLEFQPKDAGQIQEILSDVLSTPPDIAARYREIIQP